MKPSPSPFLSGFHKPFQTVLIVYPFKCFFFFSLLNKLEVL